MDTRRSLRLSEIIREELSEIIGFEMSDPRLGPVAVTDVRVMPGTRHAQISVSLSGDDREQQDALKALDHARNYLRHELARRLNIRRIPELHFQAAPSLDTAGRIELLLDRAKKKRGSTENQP